MKEIIKRESTWDYDTYDENGLQDGGTKTVATIETWEFSAELGRYELTDLVEKATGEYIPYNEADYIRDGAVTIPACKEEESAKYIVNKADDNGNIITGYEEILVGTISAVEADFRAYHDYNGPIDIELAQENLNQTRKEQVEREAREFLCKVLVETYDIQPAKAGDYICEFFWHKNCLYTSIDKLRNPTLTATLKKGVLF